MQVVLKPTLACNGTCRYCAAGSTSNGQPTLGATRLAELFRPFAAWLREAPERDVAFLWHGGEPMLPGVAYYRAARDAQRQVFGDDLPRVRNHIQSNLTLLTPEWFPFLGEFLQGAVGTSYDMLDGIRGLRNGDPLGPRWLRAVRLCLDSGLRVGVLYVIHRSALPHAREIYRYFRNVDPSLRIRFNALYREGRGADPETEPLAITPEEYGEFLVQVADEWWPERGRCSVMPLTEWYEAWRGDLGRLCCDSGGRCQETHLGICPDGSVYGCGRASDSTDPSLRLGNIFEDALPAMLARPLRRRFAQRGAGLRATHCRGCSYWAVCHGGCPMDARIYHDDPMRETWFCEGRKRIFDLFRLRLGDPPAGVEISGGRALEDLS